MTVSFFPQLKRMLSHSYAAQALGPPEDLAPFSTLSSELTLTKAHEEFMAYFRSSCLQIELLLCPKN
jgi:hypothetical protein